MLTTSTAVKIVALSFQSMIVTCQLLIVIVFAAVLLRPVYRSRALMHAICAHTVRSRYEGGSKTVITSRTRISYLSSPSNSQ